MPTKKASAKKNTKKATSSAAKVLKKTTKKASAKKTTTKKAGAKKTTRTATATKKPMKDLVYAPDQQSFWTTNGEILNSLLALRDALETMEKDVYQYHVAGGQNDFAVWVSDVLCDKDCAAELQKARTPKTARTVVVRHLKLYSL